MEFDKNRIYTAVNADNIIVGSRGYFADNLKALEEAVQQEDSVMYGEIEEIKSKVVSCRFKIKDESNYGLFYYVEEPQEKKFRPYKDTDEMIEDFKRRYNSYGGWSGKSNPMYCPLIWLRFIHDSKESLLVTRFSDDEIGAGAGWYCMDDVMEEFTYLDGTPCGISE